MSARPFDFDFDGHSLLKVQENTHLLNKQKYKAPNLARKDLSTALQQYRNLRPSVKPYYFHDGTVQNLMRLEGTIPVNYKEKTYNIPIELWIFDTHPYNPPLVNVRPTSTMQLRAGRNVDEDGIVHLPYLREWRWPISTTEGLLETLRITFGRECPVFSKVSSLAKPTVNTATQSSELNHHINVHNHGIINVHNHGIINVHNIVHPHINKK